MGITLNPREIFTIVRQLQDHTDSATYYVRAVIRNSRTDAVIKTIDLFDKGSRRFTAPWDVIADVGGLGTFIDITTSVYTDSAYTTQSGSYGDENETYLVYDRSKQGSGGGSGGWSPEVDYKKIKTMLDTAIKSIKFPKFPEMPEMPEIPEFPEIEIDLSGISGQLEEIKTMIDAIPEAPKLDLEPVLDAIIESEDRLIDAVSALPEPPATDLTPVLEAIRGLDPSDTVEALKTVVSKMETDMPDISEWANKFKDQLKEFMYVTSGEKKQTADPMERVSRLINK